MDTKAETKKFKVLMGFLIALLISGIYSCEELKYSMNKKTADADLRSITEVAGRRGRVNLEVEFYFKQEDGTGLKERDTVPIDWQFTDEKIVKVEYLPGVKNSARLAGNGKSGTVWIFFGLLAICVIFIIGLYFSAKRGEVE